jgi:hypothetical protein
MFRLLVLFALIHTSCNTQTEPGATLSEAQAIQDLDLETRLAKLGVRLQPEGNYTAALASIRKKKAAGQHSGADFENYLLNEIIPFWYGTSWDFNGYTDTPGQGEIACGYFVSTTLLHAGVNINRYHLAQQGGLNEAKSLAIEDRYWKWITGIDQLKATLPKYADGLYFVGLDNHVGFLLIRQGNYFFIHSNYIDDKVMIQDALTAPAFQSAVYVIGEITTNPLLLEKWRKGEVVKVIRA